MNERKIQSERYFKGNAVYLDHDGSKYINSFAVRDGDKETGVSVCDAGDSSIPNSNKRTVMFLNQEFPSLKAAIIAYEDAQTRALGIER